MQLPVLWPVTLQALWSAMKAFADFSSTSETQDALDCCFPIGVYLRRHIFVNMWKVIQQDVVLHRDNDKKKRGMCMSLTQQICPPLCTLRYHLYLKTYLESETPSSGTSSPLTVVEVPLRTCR